MQHYYKGYLLERNGTREFPWNIYKTARIIKSGIYAGQPLWEWAACDTTMKNCKKLIDEGVLEMCDLMCK